MQFRLKWILLLSVFTIYIHWCTYWGRSSASLVLLAPTVDLYFEVKTFAWQLAISLLCYKIWKKVQFFLEFKEFFSCLRTFLFDFCLVFFQFMYDFHPGFLHGFLPIFLWFLYGFSAVFVKLVFNLFWFIICNRTTIFISRALWHCYFWPTLMMKHTKGGSILDKKGG